MTNKDDLLKLAVLAALTTLGCHPEAGAGSKGEGYTRSEVGREVGIASRPMPVRHLEPGLWVSVHNGLPVLPGEARGDRSTHRACLQAYIEAPSKQDLAAEATDVPREGSSSSVEAAGSPSDGALGLRYVLREQLPSGAEASFWMSPQQLDALVETSGGAVYFSITDAAEALSSLRACWMDGGSARAYLVPSSEAAVQHIALRIERRSNFGYACSVESGTSSGF